MLSDVERAREFLFHFSYLGELRKVLTARRAQLMANAEGCGVDYSRVSAGSGGRRFSSVTENLAVELASLEAELSENIRAATAREREILKLVNSLDERERVIILMRYVQGKSVELIAEELHYSSRQIQRVVNNAVEALTPAIMRLLSRGAREGV